MGGEGRKRRGVDGGHCEKKSTDKVQNISGQQFAQKKYRTFLVNNVTRHFVLDEYGCRSTVYCTKSYGQHREYAQTLYTLSVLRTPFFLHFAC